jgi:DNA polymerase-3 subunit beta
MNIQVDKQSFEKALNTVIGLTRSNLQLPILNSALFELKSKKMTIKATDLNAGICIDLNVENNEDGKFLLPVAQLLEYIQTLPSGNLRLVVDKSKITIQIKGSSAELSLSDSTEYPEFPFSIGDSGVEVEAEKLNTGLKKVAIAITEDNSRPILGGFLFKVVGEEKKIQIVGTDGYRLSLIGIPYTGDWSEDFLVGAKSLMTILKGFEGKEVVFGIDKKNNQIWLKSGECRAVIRLLSGNFPEYSRIIPSDCSTKIVFSKDELYQAIQQTAVFARQNANIVKLGVGEKVTFSTQSGYSGSSEVEVGCKKDGDDLVVGFNYRYLKEYLSIVGDGEISLQFNGSLAPVKLSSDIDKEFTHIIMPVKL